ncbi:MAG: glycoside hydrolase family 2 protein [Spirochaetes bacterium]|nr:glycoside hydrolase family 2 protein [Spirochaetota bacterium]
MRSIVPLSAEWNFARLAEGAPGKGPRDFPAAGPAWTSVDLPHSMVELPYNDFDEKCLETRGVYHKVFPSPRLPQGGSVLLRFEGVAVACELWLNGARLGSHEGPYTPFSFEIADLLAPQGAPQGAPEGANELFVLVDSREDPRIPPFGGVVDYLVYGGIYRAVDLLVREALRIEDVFAKPKVVTASPECLGRAGASLAVEIGLKGALTPEAELSATLSLRGLGVKNTIAVALDGDSPFRLDFPALEGIELWDIGAPNLYDLDLELRLGDEILDKVGMRIGFRTARFEADGFYLNGRRVFLRGLNRHQSWPYVGCAMGPGPQAEDARILAQDLGLNIVRTSHYPQSTHFLDACDELGLLVFTELPGWQHVGDDAWKKKALADLESLILRDRNHACVVLWGVRINESQDDHAFYEATNTLAAVLDPTRQRGGVRYIKKSELLEDVYTFNDFSHEGGGLVLAPVRAVTGKRGPVPLLVTEHNGHMFSTKRFDQEERLAEHARRHARVVNEAAGSSRAGAIGWCAFDYNTHKDFGSGDRICYHGVSDMFRIPKYAAFFYASQKDPSRGIVLEPASLFSKGERSAARVLPIEVYTNCEAVDLYRGGQRVGRFFPDRKTYPHLEHPCVLIDDFIGDRIDPEGFSPADKSTFLRLAGKAMARGAENFGLGDKLTFASFLLRNKKSFRDAEILVTEYGMAWGKPDDSIELVGIIGGRKVIRRTCGVDASASVLDVAADAAVLPYIPGGEWNASRVLVRLLDGRGNLAPFAFLPGSIKISGPGRLLGPSRFSLIAGASAFWVATVGKSGEIGIDVEVEGFALKSLAIAAEAVHG